MLRIPNTPVDWIPRRARPIQRTAIVSFQWLGSQIGDAILGTGVDLRIFGGYIRNNTQRQEIGYRRKKTQMDPRYPIGDYTPPREATPALRQQAISAIAEAPANLRSALKGLNDGQLNTPYREGGWTLRQLAHHVPDSHMNAYVRFRLALTEQEPTIKPYEESRWAELEDAKSAPIEVSLTLLDSLHERWVRLLRSLRPEDYARTFRHPDRGVRTVDWLLFLYAWHGRHHTAHVTELRKQKGW
jgi:uncharacterized damage-inducible protein DinB